MKIKAEKSKLFYLMSPLQTKLAVWIMLTYDQKHNHIVVNQFMKELFIEQVAAFVKSEAGGEFDCNLKSIDRALHELVEIGFIERISRGSYKVLAV